MRAVALISGGLDSTLAAKLIKGQGIELTVLNFKTPFCLCDKRGSNGCGNEALKVAHDLGLELKIVNVTEDFFKILKSPQYGYGSNMNPCIDCRILMLRKAKEFMLKVGASFIVTGEVLGQRPMSQYKRALNLIEKEAGLEGIILRPLSAKLLSCTVPEKEGWVSRDKLLDFSGRTRKPQIALARNLGIKDYPCAAGGCLLTDPQFAKRTEDLLKFGELNLNNVELLKIGRHFRLSPNVKLVVGRNELENERLLNLTKDDDYLFMPLNIPVPTVLGRGLFDAELIKLSCSITCRYCDLNGKTDTDIVYKRVAEKEERLFRASSIDDTELNSFKV